MYNYDGINYQTLINQKELVLVDFFAEWCGPCQKLTPILEQVSQIKKDIFFCKVNVDNYRSLVLENKVVSFPTLILYLKGKEIKRQIGYCSQNELINFLT
ncbi:MAG: thioredoxin family protein [Candidatus Phytoplasma pyri]|uniref:thioredoxin family protein n=1 Tax=Candidatus Phytoplasma pyri TaxID=47566 RepID=UPI003983A93A